jgi:hypothetical protein
MARTFRKNVVFNYPENNVFQIVTEATNRKDRESRRYERHSLRRHESLRDVRERDRFDRAS